MVLPSAKPRFLTGLLAVMVKVSTKRHSLLIYLLLLGTIGYGQTSNWPLKGRVDLSSGFGDYRASRFHAGVDLRTGGKIGRPVFSPVDGYVWRVKMSYRGYGKGLYVKSSDGYIYVFGHLSAFADVIDRAIKSAQNEARRYCVDLFFPEDSIPIIRGQQVGLSGESGVGAPHLHFEIRSPDNFPLNPLNRGFQLDDRIRPVFDRVGFQLRDDRSLFPDGTRKRLLPVTRSGEPGRYHLDSVLYFNSPFGILVDCYDRMRSGGMQQSVYRLTLAINGQPYYRSVLDTLDFEAGPSVGLVFDQAEAANDEKRVRRLYHRPGNVYSGNRPLNRYDGLFGRDPAETIGWYEAVVVGEDSFGNRSELHFGFLWGPPGDVYQIDTATRVNDNMSDFFFRPVPGYLNLGIGSVKVESYDNGAWVRATDAQLSSLADGWLKVRVSDEAQRNTTLRLVMATESGYVISDEPFTGSPVTHPELHDFHYYVVEDGLIVTALADEGYSGRILVRLQRGDDLLGLEEESNFHDAGRHHVFIPPRPEYRTVDRICVDLQGQGSVLQQQLMNVAIAAVGYNSTETVMVDSVFTVTIGRDNVCEPRFIAVERLLGGNGSSGHINSGIYRVLPEAFVTRQDFRIDMKLDPGRKYNQRSGLCWWDEMESDWVWVDTDSLDDNTVGGPSVGGGKFAALFDIDPPVVKQLNVRSGQTLKTLRPTIEFTLIDTLSGIENDLSIDVRINGKWLIPEYDPESYRCVAHLYEPLQPGECHLAIDVTDRAGNRTEQEVKFNVIR